MTKQSEDADTIGGVVKPRASRPLLTPLQAAERLGVTVNALERWRGIGGGPVFTKLSAKSVRYRQEDLDAFVEMNRRHSTAR
jgi:predicted site-specific integrase-resolvase